MAAEPDLTYAGRVRRRRHDGWDSGPQKKAAKRETLQASPHYESMFYRFWGFPISFYKVSIDFLTLNRPNA